MTPDQDQRRPLGWSRCSGSRALSNKGNCTSHLQKEPNCSRRTNPSMSCAIHSAIPARYNGKAFGRVLAASPGSYPTVDPSERTLVPKAYSSISHGNRFCIRGHVSMGSSLPSSHKSLRSRGHTNRTMVTSSVGALSETNLNCRNTVRRVICW